MKPIFTVLKRQLASSSIPLALALLVMLLATSSAASPTALSRGNYAWLPAAAAPFFLVFYSYTKLLYLGASKKAYYLGTLACYGVLALGMSLVNTLVRLVIDPLNHTQAVINLMDVCGWWQNGPVLAAAQQFAFLLACMLFLHTLLSMQAYWYGWLADGILIAVISIFTPIAPLRGLLGGFFRAVMLNANAPFHLAVCTALCAAFALAGLAVLKHKTL